MPLETSEMERRRLFADAFERLPALGQALDAARGVCQKFQGTHPSGRRCNKRDKCPMLHVKPGQELSLATNRLHAPFVIVTHSEKGKARQTDRYWAGKSISRAPLEDKF